jgi:hypothetical protein
MNKEIISELNRIKSLMKLINEQGSADININRLNQQQLADAPKGFGVFDEYKKIEIGEGTDYPVVIPGYKTFVMGNPDPILKQSNRGTKAADFIPDVKVDENGNEYVVKNGKKYCLPNKKFWEAFSDKNYVYQITNPKNNKKFTMKLKHSESVTIPTIDADGKVVNREIKGSEASLKCLGGDNGWSWDLNIENMTLFWTKEGDKYESYNTNNPEHFDTRSDFDVWWDKWGVFVEIGIGVLAAWTGAGLAASLIRLGLFANTGLASAYAAGNTTWLSVILQSAVETGIMLPIAKYQWTRGQETDAIFSMAFSVLPFLTELGSVQKFIKGGIQPGVSKSLGSKFLAVGGEEGLKDREKYKQFMGNLTVSELMLWKATMDQFSTKEGQKVFSEALGKYLKENEIRLTDEILGNKAWVEQLDDLTAGQFSKGAKVLLKQNPIKGTGLLAQFIRVGLPLAGVVVWFQNIYDNLKSHGYDDTQIEKITNDVKKSIDLSGFFQKIVELNSDVYKKLLNDVFLEFVSKKENLEKILNGVNEDDAELVRIAENKIRNNEDYRIFLTVLPDKEKLNTSLKQRIILKLLEPKGFTNSKITDVIPLEKYNFTSDENKSGEIVVNKKILGPSDINSIDYDNDFNLNVN